MILPTNFLFTGDLPTKASIVVREIARARTFCRRLALVAAIFAAAPATADYQAAKGVVETLMHELIAEVRANEKLYDDDERLFDLIRRRVLPMVDTAAFSRLVLGRHWQSAGDEQRRAFTRAMESQMIRSYGKSLTLLLEVNRIRFLPPDGRVGGKYEIVMSSISFTSNQPPLRIGYAMHEVDGDWRIFDLRIDGLSLVKEFRRSFDREINEHGLTGLIKRLDASSH